MTVINHKIRPEYDVTLAMIEHTEVAAFCGEKMIPSVVPGTSGSAAVPGAPACETCEELLGISWQWSRLKEEKNRLLREMRALEKAHRSVFREHRERTERKRSLEPAQ